MVINYNELHVAEIETNRDTLNVKITQTKKHELRGKWKNQKVKHIKELSYS